MKTLTATYRIVTPMFIGDAEQKAVDVRPPSFKGALRFWWRALQWRKIRKDYQTDAEALRELHKQEAALFGLAAREENGKQVGGQGKFLLSVNPANLSATAKDTVHPRFSKKDAARYLGYGVMEAFASRERNTQAGQLTRACLNENQDFTMKMRFRDEIDASLQDALIALGLLGGLGSRSRHGMGSISLLNLGVVNEKEQLEALWTAPDSKSGYQDMLRELFKDACLLPGLPPYSAFSAESRVDILTQANNPYDVLQDFARPMLMYRSWGKNEKVLDQPREEHFKSDHDWSKRTLSATGFHPRRVVFGLPHNYGKKLHEQVAPEKHGRRASPLLFHVQRISENEFLGISILLKSVFLPPTEKINAGDALVPQKIEWSVITTDFLDGLAGKDTMSNRPPRFPNKEKVI